MTPPHQGVTPRVLIETEEAALALWRAGCRDGRPSDAVARPLTSTLTTTRCHRVGRARTTPDRLTSTRSPHGRPTLHLESERPRGTGGSNPSASAALTSRNTDLARSPRCRPCWRGLSWHPQQSCPSRSNEAFGTPLPSCTLRVGGYVHRGVHREDFLYVFKAAPDGAARRCVRCSRKHSRGACGLRPVPARLLLWVAASGRTALVRGLC